MSASDDQVEFATWRRAAAVDLTAIVGIAKEIHAGLPESAEVFAEKLALFADGCFVLARSSEVLGYCLSHPWRLHDAPVLDKLLGGLPDRADCLLVHDVAILASNLLVLEHQQLGFLLEFRVGLLQFFLLRLQLILDLLQLLA